MTTTLAKNESRSTLPKGLPKGWLSKGSLDRINPVNKKPSVLAEGGELKPTDLCEPEDGCFDIPILSCSPNLRKQTGENMSIEPHLRIPRSVHEDPKYYDSSPVYQAIFNRIFFLAAYNKMELDVEGVIINLEVGQLCYSYRTLLKKLGKKYTMGNLRGFLHYFNSKGFLTHCLTQQLTQTNGGERLLITLSKSVLCERDVDDRKVRLTQPLTQELTRELTQTLHSKEEILKKESNNSITSLSPEISEKNTSSKKRKKTEPATYFERDKNVSTTELEHSKLIEKFGEPDLKGLYEKLAMWKSKKGIDGGDDYRTLLKWQSKEYKSNKNEKIIKKENPKKADNEWLFIEILESETKEKIDVTKYLKGIDYDEYIKWKSKISVNETRD